MSEKTKINKLLFYIPSRLIRKELKHIPLLFPFWGSTLTPKDHMFEFFRDYSFDISQYSLVDEIEKADFIMVPYRYNVLKGGYIGIFNEYVKLAEKKGKPLFVDGTGDIEYPISYKNAAVLRIGGYRSTKAQNDIHMPFYADDLLEKYCSGKLQPRKREKTPIVGFSGWAKLSLLQNIRSLTKELPLRIAGLVNKDLYSKRKGVFIRRKVLRILENSDLVKTNFIKRGSYSGNVKTAEGDMGKMRKDFVNNLLSSDYGLAVRGDANASVRLYEVMSMGRIPVILDTDMVFPMSDTVDYSEFSLVVDLKDLDNISEKIREFHDSLSDEEFLNMQKRSREVFEKYFRVDSFTPYLMERLRTFKKEHES